MTNAAADIGWREFFRDARLQKLIDLALTNNRDLRVAVLNVEQSRAQYRIQRSDLLPTISAGASGTRQRTPGDINGTGKAITDSQYDVSLASTAYEIDLFGRVRSLNKQALENYFATEEARKSAHIALVAGDLSDPHGTHRMCHDAVARALERYKGEPPEIWYYRGAWQEWSVAEADILVPLSEEELRRKISAIFKHQSQKDRAPFPGVDEREFWQRIEERNKATAHLVDQLGLPEYFAMEAIVVRRAEEASQKSPA